MAGTWLAEFTLLCDEKKLKHRHLKVLCDTCVECGSIENIRAEKTAILKQPLTNKRSICCTIFCSHQRATTKEMKHKAAVERNCGCAAPAAASACGAEKADLEGF